jgi:hypothetical protein
MNDSSTPAETTTPVLDAEAGARLAALMAAPEPGKGKTRVIVSPRHYADLEGREVSENVVTQGIPPEGFVRFVGHFNTPIRVVEKDPNGGPQREGIQRVPLQCVIPAKTLDEAFDIFDEHAKAAAQRYVDDLRAQHVRASLSQGVSEAAAAINK